MNSDDSKCRHGEDRGVTQPGKAMIERAAQGERVGGTAATVLEGREGKVGANIEGTEKVRVGVTKVRFSVVKKRSDTRAAHEGLIVARSGQIKSSVESRLARRLFGIQGWIGSEAANALAVCVPTFRGQALPWCRLLAQRVDRVAKG